MYYPVIQKCRFCVLRTKKKLKKNGKGCSKYHLMQIITVGASNTAAPQTMISIHWDWAKWSLSCYHIIAVMNKINNKTRNEPRSARSETENRIPKENKRDGLRNGTTAFIFFKKLSMKLVCRVCWCYRCHHQRRHVCKLVDKRSAMLLVYYGPIQINPIQSVALSISRSLSPAHANKNTKHICVFIHTCETGLSTIWNSLVGLF